MLLERRPTEHGFHGVRRGKRFLRKRFTRHLFLFTAVFLVLCIFFGFKMPFHDRLERSDFSFQEDLIEVTHNVEQEEVAHNLSGPKAVTPPLTPTPQLLRPRSKHRRQHLPCVIEFADSVDHLAEPTELMNVTQFALGYIEREETYSNERFEGRFGGHQTLVERERSFHANSQTVHCGFVKVKTPQGYRSTGFDLDEKDTAYMQTCKTVVSSCIFGNSDFLRRPTSKKISEYSKKHVCFVMFVDEQTLSKLASEGSVPDERGNVGLWRIVVVRNLPYNDMRRTGKVPKLLAHRLFPSSRYSIWLDSKLRLNTDPMLIIEYFLWRTKSEYAISNHYDRHCVWDEVLQNKRLNKYNHTTIDEQFNFYQSDGLTKFDPSNQNNLLPSYVPEGSFIVRAHTPMSNLFSCLWFNEVDRFTSRDQLSFAYTYLKLRRKNPYQPFHVNMFKILLELPPRIKSFWIIARKIHYFMVLLPIFTLPFNYIIKDCERRAVTKLFHHRVLPPPLNTP